MNSNISKLTVAAAAITLMLASCIQDPGGDPVGPIDDGTTGEKGKVTFMVSAPGSVSAAQGSRGGSTRAQGEGANGHFPGGVPDDYTNYSPGADTEKWGTLFGGYPDAETEAEAFRGAVEAMAANHGSSPAARAADLARRMSSSGGATRAIEKGSAADNRIDEIAVLLFAPAGDNPSDDSDYVLAAIKRAGRPGEGEPLLTPVPGNYAMWQFTLEELADNNYRALFLANGRDRMEEFITAAGGEQAAVGDLTLQEVRTGLEIATTRKWNTDPTDQTDDGDGVFLAFPMSTVVDFAIPNTVDYAVRPVELARAMARLDVRSSLSLTTGFEIEAVAVINAEKNGRLVPATGWSKNLDSAEVNPAGGDMFEFATADFPPDHADWNSPLSWQMPEGGELENEIFLFERASVKDPYDPDYKNNPGLIIAARHPGVFPGGDVRYFRVSLAQADADGNLVPVDIVRNYAYTVDITECNTLGYPTAAEAMLHPDEMVVSVVASGQPGPADVTFNGEYQLTTDRSVVVVPAGESASIDIYTDYALGWTITAPAGVSASQTSSPGANVRDVPDRVQISFVDPTPGIVGSHSLRIIAGELHKTITVVTLPSAAELAGSSSTALTRYVGAFWRADQTGERLISLDRAAEGTDWSAFVLDAPADSPADWVVMDTRSTSDSDIWAPTADQGNHADFDRLHPVNSIVNWATGTAGANPRENYFRLGARNDHGPTPHAPARYATVLVVGGRIDNGTLSADAATYRLLYLRQGHDPDRLFTTAARPTEANMRFSPYNLTVPASGMAALGSPQQGSFELPLQGGVFTDYPTQAGAHFKGAGPLVRRAFAPWLVQYPDWMGDTGHSQPFDPRVDETCPPGYRRPTGADTQAEIPQSLWRNPAAGAQGDNTNSVFGFYADGFFDRQTIGAQATAPIGTAVAGETPQVAYWGALLHGQGADGIPTSIFFPAAGRRDHAPMLSDAGAGGFIWSTSWPGAAGPPSGWQGYFRQNPQGMMMPGAGLNGMANLTDGASVRCVAVQDYTDNLIADLALAPPGVIGIRHSDLVRLRAERATNVLGNGYFDPSITLTLRGSSTYKGTWVEKIATTGENATLLGRLEDEPVYAVYFKWGSTVAVVGGAGGDTFGPEDVVWVNPGFSAATNTWAGFTPATPRPGYGPGKYDIPAHVAASGWGDACDFVGGATAANPSGWKTPTGTPWTYADGNGESYPFGVDATLDHGMSWEDARRPPYNISVNWTDEFGGGVATDDGKMFLPAAAGREPNTGNMAPLIDGVFWNSSARDGWGENIWFVKANIAWNWHGIPATAATIRCVHPVPVEPELQMAAPGMIGIRKSDYDALRRGDKTPGDGSYSLTLRGSSTWRNHLSEIDVNNTASIPGLAALGGLETEPVYAVYFKWGSTIGMVGGPEGSAFEASKVVWVNPEYSLAQHPITDYDSFKYASTNDRPAGIDNNVEQDLRQGRGDPCMWVDGYNPNSRLTAAGGWRTPTAQENIDFLGTPGALSAPPAYNWQSGDGTFAGIGTIGQGMGNGVRLAAEGWRDAAGAMGRLTQADRGGFFWTSTTTPDGTEGVSLDLHPSGVLAGARSAFEMAKNVRCVWDVPGVAVPRGVIGYFVDGPNAGKLTLEGDKSFYNNTDLAPESRSTQNLYSVQMAYFKWGSLVATDGSNDRDGFTSADILAVPEEYTAGAGTGNGLERLRAQVDAQTTPTDKWNVFQPVAVTAGANIPTSPTPQQLAAAQGDPCAYWFGPSWRMPTQAENIAYTTGNISFSRAQAGASATDPIWMVRGGLKLLPAGHVRNETFGNLAGVGSNGFYWSASTNAAGAETRYHRLHFNDAIFTNTHTSPTGGLSVRCVRQMLAAQGVIGYIHNPGGDNHHALTLSGSREYKGTPHDPAIHGNMQFGPLSQHTVLVAYFKFGSAIAIGSEPTNNGTFTPARDMIAYPRGYTGARPVASWANIASGTSWPVLNAASPSASTTGLGDPCAIWFNDANKKWKVPSAGTGTRYWYQEGGPFFGTVGTSWANVTNGARWVDNRQPEFSFMPFGGAVGARNGAPDWSMFLSSAQLRIGTGVYDTSVVGGVYWSSTPANATQVFTLLFNGSGPAPAHTGTNSFNHSMAVRCVPQ